MSVLLDAVFFLQIPDSLHRHQIIRYDLLRYLLIVLFEFLPAFFPECRELVGPRQLGFNLKSQLIKLLIYTAVSFGLAALAVLVKWQAITISWIYSLL